MSLNSYYIYFDTSWSHVKISSFIIPRSGVEEIANALSNVLLESGELSLRAMLLYQQCFEICIVLRNIVIQIKY